ncbi:MAG TPA: hypothetical protein VJG32_17815 [Anaerolineae bacterium]|nr:hypothetical protein [Anaerolineae bacterium]
MAYVVLLEWDGVKPPSTYYRRLHSLAMRVRGDKAVSPIKRRSDGPGVIVQEGCIITPSESLARTIGLIACDAAREEGIPLTVQIAEASFEPIRMTREDRIAMNRIEETLGKRGRPEAEIDWTVVCMECMTTSAVHAAHAVNCPKCGAMRIRIRAGAPVKFHDAGSGDALDAWLRTRFSPYSGGRWEIPLLDKRSADRPPTPAPTDEREKAVVDALRGSPLLGQIAKLDRADALCILDAVFVARGYWSAERRQEERIKAAALYFQRGGSPANISLAELPSPDLLDAAGPLGAETVATHLILAERKPRDPNPTR